MARTIRWGMIGAGDVTEVKSGPGFQKATHSALVAVMRRNGALAQDYAQRHGVPRWYDDADALIHDPDVDAVYIATPPSSHKLYTLMVAQAGKPVYVEKPMALNFAECQAMVEACEKAGVPLWVAYYRRSLPRFLKIKALLNEGAIGVARSVSIRLYRPLSEDKNALPWRVQPEISGGGHFVDVGSHMLDLMDYLISPIRTVSGFAVNQRQQYPAEDQVVASFLFESGAVGTGTWCFSAAHTLDQIEVVGDKGTISFAVFADQPVCLTINGKQDTFEINHPAHVQQPLIQTIVDEQNGKGSCPSTGRSGSRTTAIMDQLLATYHSRQ